jgi:hypothetical protein
VRWHEPGLIGIGTQPKFAIGQRALLLCTPEGNILWDCISLIDDATITLINGLGGLHAIAISHPHFYTTLVDWSHAFGDGARSHTSRSSSVVRITVRKLRSRLRLRVGARSSLTRRIRGVSEKNSELMSSATCWTIQKRYGFVAARASGREASRVAISA